MDGESFLLAISSTYRAYVGREGKNCGGWILWIRREGKARSRLDLLHVVMVCELLSG